MKAKPTFEPERSRIRSFIIWALTRHAIHIKGPIDEFVDALERAHAALSQAEEHLEDYRLGTGR